MLQVTSVTELHDHVKVVLGPLYIVQLDHIGTLYPIENADLVFQILEDSGDQALFVYHLAGIKLLMIISQTALEDLAKLAFAK